jgi:hypothetical protein
MKKKRRFTFAYRVNDTTIAHVTFISSAGFTAVCGMAKRRLEKQGYTVNEYVWHTSEDAE